MAAAQGPLKIERLYILPTSHGLVVLVLNTILILVAASSGNNSVYTLGFVMFGVYLLTMIATHINLKNLSVEVVEVIDGYAGEAAQVVLSFDNSNHKTRFLIRARFRDQADFTAVVKEEVLSNSRGLLTVSLVKDLRGVYPLPSMQISSIYPMGLFRTWVNLSFKENIFIYPKRHGQLALSAADAGVGHGVHRGGRLDSQHEDFREHKRYEQGESHHHVDWKAYARSREMLTKRYETAAPLHYNLDFRRLIHLGTELALSQLAQWIEDLQNQESSFELHLPGQQIPSGRGRQHGQMALRELAKFKGGAA